MRIGILSPFNPDFIRDAFNQECIPNINTHANAVNTLVYGLLKLGHQIKVYTVHPTIRDVQKICGTNIEIVMVPFYFMPHRPDFTLKIPHSQTFMLNQFYLPKRLYNEVSADIDTIDLIHAHWTYEYANAAKRFADKKPVFVTVRDWAPYIRSIQETLIGKIEWKIKYKVFRDVMSESKIQIIANSDYTYNRIVSDYPEKEVPIIPNPIKKDYIITSKYDLSIKNQFVSISQDLCDPRKNIGCLLKAFMLYKKQFPKAQLHLVGSFDSENELFLEWSKSNLLDGVVLHGKLNHEQLIHLLDKMSCLIHPSLEETFGNILLEAMSRCIPCIGGRESGAVPQVLGDGKYGLLCDIKQPEAIVEAMNFLRDKSVVDIITQSASSMLLQQYASDIIANKHIELYSRKLYSE